jgi:outer membrane autotransporter protein
MKPNLHKLLVPLFACAFFSEPAFAQTIWTDATGDWFTAGNWDNGVPNPGIDAQINNGGEAQIGAAGATANNIILGFAAPDSGILSVAASGTLDASGDLVVGEFGSGTLNITNGGVVSNGFSSIGAQSGSTGTVTVDGAGSTWKNSFGLFVGEFGSGTLNITNGGVVSNDSAFIGSFSGSTGTVTVDGTDSTWANSSDLFVGFDGSGTLNITNGGAVSNDGFGSIGEGTGSTGTVTVDGAGSTWANSSYLSVGFDGSGTLSITNGGAVSSGFGFIGDDTDSTGTVTVDGAGSTWTNSSYLSVGFDGSGTLNITNGGTVSSGFGFIGVDAGSTGTVTVDGTGSIWTNSGCLCVGLDGSGTLNITNGGTVSAVGGNVADQAGSTGTLNIGAAPGDAAVAPGTLDTATVVFGTGAGTLNFNHTATDYVFAPAISGGGAVNVFSGTTILTAANTYTGDTTVNGGTLEVDGSIASAKTFVNPGGALAGIGTIGGNLFSSGLVSPGDSPGTLAVTGNYTQNAAGTLRIEIGGLALAQHDLLQMSGTATLDGTLQLVRFNNFTPVSGDSVVILSATGGVTGTFATVEIGGTLLSAQVIYDPTDVCVVFEQGSFILPGLTPNQQAVAENLDRSVGDSRAADLIAFLDTEPLANLPQDYDLIAPEELASIYEIGFSQATIQWQNIQRRTDDIRAGSTGFSAAGYQMRDTHGFAKGADGKMVLEKGSVMQPSPENRWGVFITGTGQFVNVGDQDLNAPGYDITTGGVTVGVDYRLSNNLAIGLSGTYAHSNADLVNEGRVEVDGGKGGLYASYFSDGFYVDLAANGGWNSYDTRRTALLGEARGNTDGAEFNGLIGAGYDWKIRGLRFGPIATFQYSYIDLDSFTEGGSLAPLHYPDQNEDSVRSTLGGRFSHGVKLGRMILRPEVRAVWQHEYNDRAYPIDAQFGSGAGGIFTVHGPRIGSDSALVGAGATLLWNERVSTYIYYDGQFGRSNYDSNNVSAGVRVSF